MSEPVLATTPKYFRAAKSKAGKDSAPVVNRTGGYRKAGLITGVSVITKGEALGHDLWIDEVFISQTIDALNAMPKGVKSRWTHPGMSSDGMGKITSRIRDGRMSADGTQLLADQHFLEIGHKTPSGDLAAYQMDLAEEDPEAYGLSIVFALDDVEVEQFVAEHADADGTFQSPDPLNTNNYPHARLAELRGADAVDDPAANPNGLFAREQDIARQADQLAAFALGLSKKRPAVAQLGLDPDRVRGFASRFLQTHRLELIPMQEKTNTPEIEDTMPEPETKITPEETTPAEQPETVAAGREGAAQFLAAFGNEGAVWFAQGLTWQQAEAKRNAQRDDELKSLQASVNDRFDAIEARLNAGLKANGESQPVGFTAADKKAYGGFAAKIRIVGQPSK